MKFPDIQEVKEASSARGANTLLQLGWRLLEILPSRNPRHNAIYILGARTHTNVDTQPLALDDESLKI